MMNIRLTVLVLFSACAPLLAHADFYKGKAEGWHWYAEMEEITFDEDPPAEPTKPPEKEIEKKEEAPAEQVQPGPAPLSHDWVKENLQNFLTRAIDDPTPDNARAYLYLQRVANDKAEGFSEAAQLAIMKDPYLSEVDRRPLSSAGGNLFSQQAGENKNKVLGEISDQAELWYFFNGQNCAECVAQWKVVEELQRRHQFKVRAISVDGAGSDVIGDHIKDRGQFNQLGLRYLPTLLMAKPPESLITIGIGVTSVNDSETKIVRLAADEKWIDHDTLNSTRAVRQVSIDLDPTSVENGVDLSETENFLKFIDSIR
jgi:conjugal transfer pilus assembly protein TraF